MAADPDKHDSALLARIGAHARDEQRDDAHHERVALGEESAEGSEVGPLDSAAIDRITARAVASLGAKSSEKKEPAAAPAPKDKDNVVRATFGRWLITLAGPLAIAAALVLFISSQRGPTKPTGPELPLYAIAASGEQTTRGAPGAVGGGAPPPESRLHLGKTGRDGRYAIVLRPATAPIGKVVAYAFVVGDVLDNAEPLDAKVEIAPEGSVRITGPSRSLEGARRIRVVVGAPEAIGKFDDALARVKSPGEGDAHVRVLTIEIDRDR